MITNFLENLSPQNLDLWTLFVRKVHSNQSGNVTAECELELDEFHDPMTLKLSEVNFTTTEQVEAEIHRILNKFDSYTRSIDSLKAIAESNTNYSYGDQGSWTPVIHKVLVSNPIEAVITFEFYRTNDSEVFESFTKEFFLKAHTFISFETYQQELNNIVHTLNFPQVEIVYEQLIKQTVY